MAKTPVTPEPLYADISELIQLKLTALDEARALLVAALQSMQGVPTGPGAPTTLVTTRKRQQPAPTAGMSAAARKKVSLRMKKYWAERRKNG